MSTGRIRRYTIGVAMAAIMVLSAILIFATAVGPAQPSEGASVTDTRGEVVSSTYAQIPVQLFFKESSGLSPKSPQKLDADITQSCPDGFKHDGLLGFGIIPIGHMSWKNVGVWKSEPLKSDLVIGGKMTYTLWTFTKPGTNSKDGKFKMTLMSNDQPLGGTSAESGTRTINQEPTQITWEVQIGGNITPLQPGDVLSVKLECWVNGGCYMYYGGPTYNTGVTLTCNSLRIPGVSYDAPSMSLHVQVSEAFGLAPAQLNPQLMIDDTTVKLDAEMGFNSATFMRELIYYVMLLDGLSNGAHKATIILTYSPGAAINVTQDYAFNYNKPKDSVFDTITKVFNTQVVVIIIFFVILAIGCIVVIKVVKTSRNRKGLDGLVGKPGGFWDRRRKKKAAKKAEKQRLKAEKQRLKDMKKQAKLAKKK